MNRSEASRALVMRPARAATGAESSKGPIQAKSASRSAGANSVSRSSAEAKLAMAEFLLVREDMSECAQQALEWLRKHAGVHKALCLAVEPSQKQLTTLASLGLNGTEPEEISLDLADGQHPFVAALFQSKPVVLRGGFSNPRSAFPPYGPDAFTAIPMGGGDQSAANRAVGLLVVSPASSRNDPDLQWLIDYLMPVLRRRLGTGHLSEAERSLRRERTLLYNILNTVHDPIILTDTEGRLVISNRSAELLFGAREEESEGRRRAVALNNMFLSAALSQHAIEEPSLLGRELLLADPADGSDLFFEFANTVFSDVHEGTGVVTVLRNVGDLRRTTQELEENYRRLRFAEEEVRAERDRLDLIIDSVAEPILVTDPEGKIIMMNDPAERLFTMPPSALPEAAQNVQANDINFSSFVSNLFLMSEGRQHHGGISLVDPEESTPVPVEAISAKLISVQGELLGVVTILHDQSEALEKARLYEQLRLASEALEEKVREATAELVRQNEVLRRQHMELQQASQLKSQFLANVSHELRTPLNSIIGYTRILMQGISGNVTPQQRVNLSRMDANAGRLLTLINQLLDITRIEAGKMAVTMGKVSLSTMIAEVMAEVEPLILQAKLEVTRKVQPDLPEIRSDREKIKQILLNLLMNALKFTPKGWVDVSATYQGVQDRVTITVSDSGIGIAESEQEKIFEDFRRSDDSVAKGYAGVGLGLSICRRLAVLIGGRITLDSKLGQGSAFTLTLPRAPRTP
jgi:PAS domain S-box-containing protein